MPSFSLLLTLAVIALHTTLASARPIDNSGNAYGGKGGYASGGNVTYPEKEKNLLSSLGLGKSLMNLKSGNAGHGGHAESGTALGGLAPTFGGPLAGIGGSNSGNAYTKDGGVADGGSVQGTNDALINIDSNNAGHGGAASSGAAVGSSGSGWKDDHGDELDGDHEDHHWDDHEDYDHEDYDHKDDYDEDDYEEDYVDRKRHEHGHKDEKCNC